MEGAIEQLVSIVLPVHNQADHVEQVVASYADALARLSLTPEFILVPNGCSDDSVSACKRVEQTHRATIVVLEQGGWGRAVKAGLACANGRLICYTNLARTRGETLSLIMMFASAYPNAVVKVNRKIHDSAVRRFGSLLYNLECRALYGLATWDINGTPKVFPSSFSQLRELSADDDLIDVEFLIVCKNHGYQVLEVPLLENVRHAGKSTTGVSTAVRLYWGAWSRRRELLGVR